MSLTTRLHVGTGSRGPYQLMGVGHRKPNHNHGPWERGIGKLSGSTGGLSHRWAGAKPTRGISMLLHFLDNNEEGSACSWITGCMGKIK